jgi:hypothetical protein
MRDDLRVPRAVVRVELLLAGQAPRQVELFVPEDQSVAQLLEGGGEFLPAHDVEADGWMVLRRAQVVWVRLAGEAVELFEHRHEVRLELASGGALDGSLLYQAPAERARVVDHLNQPVRFVDLWQDDRRCLVNKAFIVMLTERGEPWRASTTTSRT